MTKSDEIRAILHARYDYCGRIPHGAAMEIAKQVGCSREFVRQVARREGYLTAKQWQPLRPKPLKVCARCEKPVDNRSHSDYCHECQYVTLPCNWCGKSIKRVASRVAWEINRGRTGTVYCDRKCFGNWLGHNHGYVAHPENIRGWKP